MNHGDTLKHRGLRLCLCLAVLALAAGCRPDYNERLITCPDNALVESVHCFGADRMLRPAAGYEWNELVREPFREYGRPPITLQELEQRYGTPLSSWEVEGRPFAEFARPEGILRLGLARERSGSSAYEAWRLRLLPNAINLSQILEEQALACLRELLVADATVVLLGHERAIPRVVIRFDEGQIQEVVWPNIDPARNPSSKAGRNDG